MSPESTLEVGIHVYMYMTRIMHNVYTVREIRRLTYARESQTCTHMHDKCGIQYVHVHYMYMYLMEAWFGVAGKRGWSLPPLWD